MWFNKPTTADGIEALRQYRTAYDEKLKTFADTDIADAARYMAIVAREIAPPVKETKPPVGVSLSDPGGPRRWRK